MPMKKYTSRPSRGYKRTRTARSKTPARRFTAFPRRSLAIAAPGVGLGTSATTVLRTSFFANVNSAVTGIYTGYLKPGSAFDPTGDIAAIQPQMYDQFAAMYNRYKVNRCKVVLKIIGVGSTSTDASWVLGWNAAAFPAVDPTPLATYQAAASQQYAKTVSSTFAMVLNNAAATHGIGSNGRTMIFDFSHKAILGDKVDAYDNGALVTGDPTALQYAVLPIFLQCSSGCTGRWNLEVDIFQTVTFSQKKNTVDA